jgi:hypothetical protein
LRPDLTTGHHEQGDEWKQDSPVVFGSRHQEAPPV